MDKTGGEERGWREGVEALKTSVRLGGVRL